MCSNTLPRNSNFNSAFAELRPTTSCNSVLPFWTSTLPNFSTTWGENYLWKAWVMRTLDALFGQYRTGRDNFQCESYLSLACFARKFASSWAVHFFRMLLGICDLNGSDDLRSWVLKLFAWWFLCFDRWCETFAISESLDSSAQDVRRVIERKCQAKMFFFVPRVFNKVGACSKPRGRRKREEGLIVKPEKKSSCLHILYVHVGVCISTSVHGCVFVCKLMHVRNREKQAVICVWKIVEAYIGAFELERAINKSQN